MVRVLICLGMDTFIIPVFKRGVHIGGKGYFEFK